MPPRYIVGCMTGTSLDGLDAALLAVENKGLDMTVKVVQCLSKPLGALEAGLRGLADQQAMTPKQISTLSLQFALLHADTITELVGKQKLDLIAVHGQTVFHEPPASWQLFNAAPVAKAFNAPVVFDFRAADLAAGGQGAPITPLADHVLFRNLERRWAILNLGGYCNATVAPEAAGAPRLKGKPLPNSLIKGYIGFDICACNHLLDRVARELLKKPYDEGGKAARAGRIIDDAMWSLAALLGGQHKLHRSLGTGDELGQWMNRYKAKVSPQDLAHTVCEAVSQAITHALAQRCKTLDRILLAGGGVKNQVLVDAIKAHCQIDTETTDQHGIPAKHREAICMAVLGALCQDRVPITIPSVTGVADPAPIGGVWALP